MKEKIDNYAAMQAKKAEAAALKEADYYRIQEKKRAAAALKEADYYRIHARKETSEATERMGQETAAEYDAHQDERRMAEEAERRMAEEAERRMAEEAATYDEQHRRRR